MSHRKALHVVKKEKKKKSERESERQVDIFFLRIYKEDNIQKT